MDQVRRKIRHHRLRQRLAGTAARPRVSIYRSNRTMSIQMIDDERQQTLVSIFGQSKSGQTKLQAAEAIGKDIAAAAKKAGITKVVFDRAGYKYHGRVKAVAEALRAGGLEF